MVQQNRYFIGMAEGRSLYVLCGHWMHCIGRTLPIVLALAAVVLGLVVDRNGWAIAAGLVCSTIMLILGLLHEPDDVDKQQFTPRWAL